MKTVVAVVVYDRKYNIEKWIHAWKQSRIADAELRIIHNVHPQEPIDKIQELVEGSGITYIPRQNIGMDIGAFQDVCRRRLKGFIYDFEYIIWLTDDTLPMRESFVAEFISPLFNKQIGMTCYEISSIIKMHVRTTGFCLRADTLSGIFFDVDPIRTKDDCYRFEHRSDKNLYMQIRSMNMDVFQISPVPEAPVWDMNGGGIKWPDREQEFNMKWKINMPPSKVIVIATAYNTYPTIVASMLTQTYTNWELHLVYDGPAPSSYPRFSDKRIIFTETPSRRKEYGHPIRMEWLDKVRDKKIEGKYVVVTNHDNFHVPHYLEKLVHPLDAHPEYAGSYCSMMVHNYQGGDGYDLLDPEFLKKTGHIDDGYGIIETKPQVGYIDCAAAMVRSEIAGQAGWPSTRHSSDWDYLNNIAWRSGGWDKFKKVFGALLIHN